MASYPTSIPAALQPVVGSNGLITQPWLLFFSALWNRTGGSGGGGSSVTIDSTTEVTLTGPNAVVFARDDADAATKGVAVGKFYHNYSVFQTRLV